MTSSKARPISRGKEIPEKLPIKKRWREKQGSTMIISYKHKFIFIHCRKVAGTSIATLLSEFLGPNDIQVGTWASAYQRGMRPNKRFFFDLLDGSILSQIIKIFLEKPSRILTPQRIINVLNSVHEERYSKQFRSPVHPTALEVRSFDEVAWDSFFKFCFVRNPYERAVSDYLFISRIRGLNISFLEFLKSLEMQIQSDVVFKKDFDNWPMYTINDVVSVDFVGRYENLNNDLKMVLNQIGLQKNNYELPSINTSPKKYNYKDFYTGKAELELVGKLFKKEIDYFGYAFTSP